MALHFHDNRQRTIKKQALPTTTWTPSFIYSLIERCFSPKINSLPFSSSFRKRDFNNMKISQLFPETLELPVIITLILAGHTCISNWEKKNDPQATHRHEHSRRSVKHRRNANDTLANGSGIWKRWFYSWLAANSIKETLFSTCAHRHAPLRREKKTYRKQKEKEKTERPRSKEEKTKRTGVGERDRGKREGEAERGGVILAVQPFLEH